MLCEKQQRIIFHVLYLTKGPLTVEKVNRKELFVDEMSLFKLHNTGDTHQTFNNVLPLIKH